MKSIVYQSYRTHDVPDWINLCLGSVSGWAQSIGADYRFYGDELFERVPDWYLEKTKERKVVATDLARLILAKELFDEGYDRVIWCDADMLVFAPDKLTLDVTTEYAFGREVWVQKDSKDRLKAYRKIHNAFFVFMRDNSFLDFYIHSCLSIVRRLEGQMVPQIVGPKFLSAIHNIVDCPVIEGVGMFSPLVLHDLLGKGDGEALACLHRESWAPLYGANLSASMEGVESDGVCVGAEDMKAVCNLLLDRGYV